MTTILLSFFVAALFAPLLFRVFERGAFFILAAVPAAGFLYTVLNAEPVLGTSGSPPVRQELSWLPELGMSVVFQLDALSWIMSLIVTGVGALIFIYSARYFEADDQSLSRFASVLMAFAGMMYGLVIADELLVIFIFWEGTTVFSYLLIGHFNTRVQSRRSALQALIVTTFGGLAMLVGIVFLAASYGTMSLTRIVQVGYPDTGTYPMVIAGVLLLLVGAMAKSALLPFHFWLPGAMAAPTPVSAYLHAAAMVKAGIYLILRLAPGFSAMPGWQPVLLTVGISTMLLGAWRALKQYDLKLVLAYGTVSQLGLLAVMASFGTASLTLAALAMLVSHALFKSTLFLVVGIIDHWAGTRDLRKLSGFGREDPLLAAVGTIAAASMAGVPPLLGFVAKEASYGTLLDDGSTGAAIALIGIFVGSVFTFAYATRFVWGAFFTKSGVEAVAPGNTHPILILPTVVLVAGIFSFGLFPGALQVLLQTYTAFVPPAAGETELVELSLWHGVNPALGLSVATIILGALIAWVSGRDARLHKYVPELDFNEGYRRAIQGLERTAAFVTARTQRGSLPFYQAVILLVTVGSLITALALNRTWPDQLVLADSWQQWAVAATLIAATIGVLMMKKRFAAVVVVSISGYAMVAFFAFQGAPDLALTQGLVETITLVVFILVLRRLPSNLTSGKRKRPFKQAVRIGLAVAFGAVMSIGTIVAMAARSERPISTDWGALAWFGGHGRNIVNVTLVDIRAWDTLGELAVVVVAATGIASLIFINNRGTSLQRMQSDTDSDPGRKRGILWRFNPVYDAVSSEGADVSRYPQNYRNAPEAADEVAHRGAWLLAGRTLNPRNRSIILEVTVRLLFHPVMVFSVYLLFAGHNLPGGGFAAGLVAGLAFIMRYLAGGRWELAEAAPINAGLLLGLGMTMAALTAVGGLLWGDAVLSSVFVEIPLGPLGDIAFGTSTLFDIGVYLIVLGLMLDILRTLGAQVDRHQEEDEDRLTQALSDVDEDFDTSRMHAIMGRIDRLDGAGQHRGDSL